MIAGLRTRDLGREHVHVTSCRSTQDLALELARQGAAHGTLVTCDEQTHGRGRMGRPWYSGGSGVALSVVLSQAIAPLLAPPLSIVAGVGVVMGLRLLGSDVSLKWPNDVWQRGKKVGGLLTTLELAPRPSVVVGIGLNLGFDPATVDDSLQGRAAALDLHPRDLLLGELLRCVEIATAAYLAGVAMAPEANRLLALRSEKVRVTTPHGIVEGTVMGIHDDYSLGLHTATGPRAIAVGDVWPVEQVRSS